MKVRLQNKNDFERPLVNWIPPSAPFGRPPSAPFRHPCPGASIASVNPLRQCSRDKCGCHLSPAMALGATGNMHSFLIFPPAASTSVKRANLEQPSLAALFQTTHHLALPQRLHAPPSALSSRYTASTSSKGLARPELEQYPPTACSGRQGAQALVKTVRNKLECKYEVYPW